MQNLSIILANNYVNRSNLIAEHGFSIFIRYEDKDIIFDTGSSQNYFKNCSFMNIPKVDTLILSHFHQDHTGGIPCFPDKERVNLYIPAGLKEFPNAGTLIDELDYFKSLHIIQNTTLLWKTTVLIETQSLYKGYQINELSILCGSTLFTGCSHAGITSILAKALTYSPVTNIVGGFHLVNTPKEELEIIADSFSANKVECVYPCHCSGYDLIPFLENHNISWQIPSVGTQIVFQ